MLCHTAIWFAEETAADTWFGSGQFGLKNLVAVLAWTGIKAKPPIQRLSVQAGWRFLVVKRVARTSPDGCTIKRAI